MTMPDSVDRRRGGPLAGVRVLSLESYLAGNHVTYLLTLFGAEVIKIEQPGVGDGLPGGNAEGLDVRVGDHPGDDGHRGDRQRGQDGGAVPPHGSISGGLRRSTYGRASSRSRRVCSSP